MNSVHQNNNEFQVFDDSFDALIDRLSHFKDSFSSRRLKDAYLGEVLAGRAFLQFDGAMGTQLQEHGLQAGSLPELLCLTNPAEVTAIHRAYVQAGAQVVTTNTFGANASKLGNAASVEEIFSAAVACAKASGARYVAGDIGPTGSLLQPMGTLSFDDAYELFAQQARAADKAGVDLFIIETMTDLAEAKAALLAVRENTDLPAFVTMTFGEDGRTFLGTTPEVAAVTLSSLGADAVGINCSLGPAEVAPLVARMLPWANCPIMVQANAGLPLMDGDRTYYSIGPEEYCAAVEDMVDAGVTIIGGCCGTSPAYIQGETELLRGRHPIPRSLNDDLRVASAQTLIDVPMGHVCVVGERINPTGKKRLKEALRSGNYDYVMSEGIAQDRAGAQVLDVNAGLPEIDEKATLLRLVQELQGVTTLPLQIDSTDIDAIEAAVRRYPGKPIINSTNGKIEILEAVLPIAKRYGCVVIGLALDENGIPSTAQGRLDVARKIVAATDAVGIPRHDVVIDCLAMAASTDQTAPRQILDGINLVKRELTGVRCVLGVSNISFGLPYRELVNATFLSAAFAAGLDLAIINPLSQRYMDVIASWRVLTGEDESAQSYVASYANRQTQDMAAHSTAVQVLNDAHTASSETKEVPSPSPYSTSQSDEQQAFDLVLTGRKGPMPNVIERLLAQHDQMYVINQVLIPALDEVGDRFEKGTFFLPQLMASAEAAKAGFSTIRDIAAKNSDDDFDTQAQSKGSVVIATVKGDIHDIGKNIVHMLLENYGYDVIDLGRDVDPQVFVDEVVRRHVNLAGLSALMTTTVGAMKQTIDLLREQAPWCKVMVGGAVLNPEYTQMVGADYYAKDAAAAAHIAGEVLDRA